MGYYRGQGKVLLATRDGSGNAGPLRYLGKTAEVNGGLQAQTQSRKESETGQRLTALRYSTDNQASLSFKIEDAFAKNWALAFRGTAGTIAAGTVSGEVLASGAVVGDILRLAKPDATSIVITDSTGSPKTLTLGTNYRVFNAKTGSIEIIDLTAGGPFVQPLKAAYSNALADSVPMFTAAEVPYWFRFEGLNDVDSGKAVLIEFYKVYLDPTQTFPFKGDEPATFDINGAPVYDDTKAADAVLGQFGRVVLMS